MSRGFLGSSGLQLVLLCLAVLLSQAASFAYPPPALARHMHRLATGEAWRRYPLTKIPPAVQGLYLWVMWWGVMMACRPRVRTACDQGWDRPTAHGDGRTECECW